MCVCVCVCVLSELEQTFKHASGCCSLNQNPGQEISAQINTAVCVCVCLHLLH